VPEEKKASNFTTSEGRRRGGVQAERKERRALLGVPLFVGQENERTRRTCEGEKEVRKREKRRAWKDLKLVTLKKIGASKKGNPSCRKDLRVPSRDLDEPGGERELALTTKKRKEGDSPPLQISISR